MSGITEIYICKFGERLEDGALQTTDEILSRIQAERDAQDLCRRDPTIDKIAYYAVEESGKNRHLLTYTNPHHPRRTREHEAAPADEPRAAIRLRKPAQPSLWRRILALFG